MLRAVFFDVGDTLVEGWAPVERINEIAHEVLCREFGERPWFRDFLEAKFGPAAHTLAQHGTAAESDELLRQQTLEWYASWFANSKIGVDDIDLDRLRTSVTVPLELVSTLVPGAPEALEWCKAKGLRVCLVTNTLSRGDDEVWEDWRRFGLSDHIDAVVSSHSVGWQKPHRAIFERALSLTGARADEAVMVGDNVVADIGGAKRLGMRAVLRRTADAPFPGRGSEPGTPAPVAGTIEPDAVIDDLTVLPAVLAPWLAVPSAQRGLP